MGLLVGYVALWGCIGVPVGVLFLSLVLHGQPKQAGQGDAAVGQNLRRRLDSKASLRRICIRYVRLSSNSRRIVSDSARGPSSPKLGALCAPLPPRSPTSDCLVAGCAAVFGKIRTERGQDVDRGWTGGGICQQVHALRSQRCEGARANAELQFHSRGLPVAGATPFF